MAITVDQLWFETQRRAIIYKAGTVMPDDSLLGYEGDPNNVDQNNSDGELLIYYAGQGTLYQQSTGEMWRKTLTPNTWSQLGAGGGGGYTGGDGGGDV